MNNQRRTIQESECKSRWKKPEPKKAPEGDGNEETPTVVKPRLRMHDLLQRPFRHPFGRNHRALPPRDLLHRLCSFASLLLPFVLALLLGYLLRPIVRFLARAKIPPIIGARSFFSPWWQRSFTDFRFLAAPAAGWLEKAPYSLHQLEQKLLPIKKPMEKVAQASGAIENLATTKDAQAKTQTVEVKQHSLADKLVVQTPELVISALTMLHPALFPARLRRRLSRQTDQTHADAFRQKTGGLHRARD